MRSRFVCAMTSFLFAGSTMLAAGKPCSVHPNKGATRSELAALARIPREEAQKAAVASLEGSSEAAVQEAELEAEHGCLVYSFDIAVGGNPGVQEVQVDAGDGRVLSSVHESPKAEADEKAKDRPKAPRSP
jgi:hypothetical protein